MINLMKMTTQSLWNLRGGWGGGQYSCLSFFQFQTKKRFFIESVGLQVVIFFMYMVYRTSGRERRAGSNRTPRSYRREGCSGKTREEGKLQRSSPTGRHSFFYSSSHSMPTFIISLIPWWNSSIGIEYYSISLNMLHF